MCRAKWKHRFFTGETFLFMCQGRWKKKFFHVSSQMKKNIFLNAEPSENIFVLRCEKIYIQG